MRVDGRHRRVGIAVLGGVMVLIAACTATGSPTPATPSSVGSSGHASATASKIPESPTGPTDAVGSTVAESPTGMSTNSTDATATSSVGLVTSTPAPATSTTAPVTSTSSPTGTDPGSTDPGVTDASSATEGQVEGSAEGVDFDERGNAVVWADSPGETLDRFQAALAWPSGGKSVIPGSQPRLVVLIPATPPPGYEAALGRARTLAQNAGAWVQKVAGDDPRADPAAIEGIADHPPLRVIAVGPDFGPVDRLVRRVSVAATGVQLPGGGQVMFPGRTFVALYGYPGSTSLGALGQQDLPASIARAEKLASEYRSLLPGAVVPTFEIIATVATASAGSDGMYSAQSTVGRLKPWVEAATEAGMYVLLDLQPGRASLLRQANAYIDLLRLPNVGLALDPEWKLAPGQRPLQQIGGVDAAEVNSVIDWLGRLTSGHRLPQKLLVLHQFQLSMLRDSHDIVTDNDNVAVLIHMDGQGSAAGKRATWNAVTKAAPEGVTFGWKNFLAIDKPVFTPAETVAQQPVPVMISYQ